MPLPDHAGRGVKSDIRCRARNFFAPVDERPSEGVHTEDRDILDPVRVLAFDTEKVEGSLPVRPGLH